MITDLNTSVSTISSEALDKLFSETPDNQVNADDIKVPVPEEKKMIINSDLNIPNIDIDEIEEVDEKKVKKDDKKEEEEIVEVKKVEDKKEEPDQEEIQSRKDFLKNSVNYLVEKGIFKDFEGRDELEVDDEIFSKLLERQVEKQIEDRYESKKKSAGEFGEAILEYLDNDGEPDKIIDLFKEKKALDEFQISDDDSQIELISKWYKEVHGWKSEKIKKYIDTLNAEEGLLEGEAEEIKGKYQESYRKQLEDIQNQQKEYKEDQVKKQKVFETNINKVIESNKDFDIKRKKFIKDSIFKFKTLEDGSKVNDFYVKFAEWQNNPEQYIELAEFVLDKEGYLKRKSVDIENKVVDKTFNFIKGNSALSKTKGSKHVEKEDSNSTGTDFSVMFK